MSKSSGVQRDESKSKAELRRSWDSTARYLLVQLAQAVPTAVCLRLAYVHH
jgi:hypothetical protein